MLSKSFGIDTDIGSMRFTTNLFQLPLLRSNRVDSVPPASNLIYLLKIDTTGRVVCGSYFNVAKCEENKFAQMGFSRFAFTRTQQQF